jgi:ketosteroid isomerase-like protein
MNRNSIPFHEHKKNTMTSKEKENKELVRHIFTEIGKGNHQPFLEAVAEGFTVTCIGTTLLSGTYKGIKKVIEEFTTPVMASFETPPTVND